MLAAATHVEDAVAVTRQLKELDVNPRMFAVTVGSDLPRLVGLTVGVDSPKFYEVLGRDAPRPRDSHVDEVTSKAMRRRFTLDYKRKIVQEADRCKTSGAVGRCCAGKGCTRRI